MKSKRKIDWPLLVFVVAMLSAVLVSGVVMPVRLVQDNRAEAANPPHKPGERPEWSKPAWQQKPHGGPATVTINIDCFSSSARVEYELRNPPNWEAVSDEILNGWEAARKIREDWKKRHELE